MVVIGDGGQKPCSWFVIADKETWGQGDRKGKTAVDRGKDKERIRERENYREREFYTHNESSLKIRARLRTRARTSQHAQQRELVLRGLLAGSEKQLAEMHVTPGSRAEHEIYFLRFFSRVRSSFIDIVDCFLLSSINFQKVEEV